jgi:hypothetical protein
MSKGAKNPPTWIENGEKYALVGLSVKLEGHIPTGKISSHLWVLSDTKFDIPPHWRGWLGSIRVEEVEHCDLFLISKLRSLTPGVLDGENIELQKRVSRFYADLLLASTFTVAYKPVMLSGSRQDGEIDIRQQSDFDPPVPSIFRHYRRS